MNRNHMTRLDAALDFLTFVNLNLHTKSVSCKAAIRWLVKCGCWNVGFFIIRLFKISACQKLIVSNNDDALVLGFARKSSRSCVGWKAVFDQSVTWRCC